ncbi:MAG: sensor domain-containing diguanylate cyclase [Zetaproteobacteria bacterium CG_4_9_14_3_um_filter_53_7]|nr:MAG: sensor domain-containing diguanylate cyclase [Zetaproteobacteria bacterium CG_4_9_14_3_um_filter_53_7]
MTETWRPMSVILSSRRLSKLNADAMGGNVAEISLKRRVFVPLIAASLTLFLLSIFTIYHMEERHWQEHTGHADELLQHHLRVQQQDAVAMMTHHLQGVAEDKAMVSALMAHDRDTLLKLATPLFNNFKASGNISHFYFHTPDLINLLRVHQPDRYGDTINRVTAEQAKQTGALAFGMEMGPLGTFTLRVVLPLFEQSKLLGFIELGVEANLLLEHIEQMMGWKLILLTDKEHLQRNDCQQGISAMGLDSNWDALEKQVLSRQSLDGVSSAMLAEAISDQGNVPVDELHDLTVAERHYWTAGIPAIDVANRKTGEILILIDMTETIAETRWSIFQLSAAFALLGLAVLSVFLRILGKTETDLRTARQQVIDESAQRERMQAAHIEQLQQEHQLLHESEEKFQKISSSAQDAVICVDDHANISFWNAAAERIFGYTAQEAVGTPVAEYLAPCRFRTIFIKSFAKFQQSGMAPAIGRVVELEALRKGGEVFPAEISLAASKIAGKWNSIAILRDITDRKRNQLALEASRNRQRLILESAGDGIYGLDLQGKTTFINPAAARMLASTEEELLGQPMHDLLHHTRADGSHFPKEQCPIYAAIKDGQTRHVKDDLFWRMDGSSFPVDYISTPIVETGEIVGAVVTFNDITERKQADQEIKTALHIQRVLDSILNIALPPLSMKEVLARALDEVLSIPSFALLNKGSIFLVRDHEEMLEMAVQKNLNDALLSACALLPFGRCLCGKAAASRKVVFVNGLDHNHEITYKGINPHGHYCLPIISEGTLLGVLNLYVPAGHRDSEAELLYLKTVADTLATVIERKHNEERLHQLAHNDQLTGLPNRTLFHDRLQMSLAMAERHGGNFALMFLDLDHFKEINDTLGHDAGDELLKQVSTRLLQCVRKSDTVARMGGDEFTVILSNVSKEEQAAQIAEKIIAMLSEPFELGEHSRRIGCSIGIALYPFDGVDITDLLKNADIAMYRAKETRNSYRYFSHLS